MPKGLLVHNPKAESLDEELLGKLVSALGEVVQSISSNSEKQATQYNTLGSRQSLFTSTGCGWSACCNESPLTWMTSGWCQMIRRRTKSQTRMILKPVIDSMGVRSHG